ncbi:MAG: porphyrinogen peroxidase, partial [Actinomycetota bacterium]|nr:porphyrinogen peroxidase [Actinomycetota bacterium]
DLIKFHSLPQEEQEGVIGRTKPDSIELDDDVKPLTAHISRVVMEDDDGNELEIWRRSVPFGTALVQGLQFVAFSHDPTIFTRMLERMYGESDDGLRDQLTSFTKPVTGSVFFAPSIEALQGIWEPS